jgi:hypothetical protein
MSYVLWRRKPFNHRHFSWYGLIGVTVVGNNPGRSFIAAHASIPMQSSPGATLYPSCRVDLVTLRQDGSLGHYLNGRAVIGEHSDYRVAAEESWRLYLNVR